MEEIEINLNEILKSFDIHTGTRHKGANIDVEIRKAMLEFGKQLLELAAENAKTIETSIEDWEEIDYESDFNYIPLMNEWEEIEGLNKIIIDKQSILNTINQIE